MRRIVIENGSGMNFFWPFLQGTSCSERDLPPPPHFSHRLLHYCPSTPVPTLFDSATPFSLRIPPSAPIPPLPQENGDKWSLFFGGFKDKSTPSRKLKLNLRVFTKEPSC